MRWQESRDAWDDDEDGYEDDEDESEDGDLDDYGDDTETLPCPSCGFTVYEDSPWCPSCGQYVTFDSGSGAWNGRPKWWIVLGILGVGAAVLTMLAV